MAINLTRNLPLPLKSHQYAPLAVGEGPNNAWSAARAFALPPSFHAAVSRLRASGWFPTILVLASVVVVALWIMWRPWSSAEPRIPIPLDRLLSNDSRPPEEIVKIDSSGRYQRFDDVTTIMKVQTQLSPAYEAAHELLVRDFSRILSPTPVSSYHVTLHEVIGLKRRGSLAYYNGNLTLHLPRLERLLYQFSQQTGTVTFRIREVSHSIPGGSAIVVILDPKTEADAVKLQDLMELAQSTLGEGMYVPWLAWHMSVGYKVPGVVPRTSEEFVAVLKGLQEILEGVDVVCDMPILSVVHDMWTFDPL